MIEPEICFAGLEELFALIEGYIKYSIDYCFKNIKDDLEFFNKLYKKNRKKYSKGKGKNKNIEGFDDLIEYLERIYKTPFKRMSYTEAIKYLEKEISEKKVKFKEKVYWGMDFGSEHERYICE